MVGFENKFEQEEGGGKKSYQTDKTKNKRFIGLM